MSDVSTARRMVFLALDGVQTLDVAGPMEVFAVANRLAGPGSYDLLLASVDGGKIQTHAGLELGPTTKLSALTSAIDTLVVCGGSEAAMLAARREGAILGWLKGRADTCRRIVSICTGAFVLGSAGLLDGRRATTHWNACEELARRFPAAEVEPDGIFVIDPPIYTSAGVTAGIDLSLALVEADHGPDLALAVARELVLFLRRPGGQGQFSAGIALRAGASPPIQRLAAAILDDPAGHRPPRGRSVPEMAAAAAMSERTFSRAFKAQTGLSPARYVEEARLVRAKSLLEVTDDPLSKVAHQAGFGSSDSLFRAFQKSFGVTPGEYRTRFSRRPQGLPRS